MLKFLQKGHAAGQAGLQILRPARAGAEAENLGDEVQLEALDGQVPLNLRLLSDEDVDGDRQGGGQAAQILEGGIPAPRS